VEAETKAFAAKRGTVSELPARLVFAAASASSMETAGARCSGDHPNWFWSGVYVCDGSFQASTSVSI